MEKLPACPRCDANQTGKIADSPIEGRWKVYRCPNCNYVWRTSENLEGVAKLTKSMIDETIPTVP